MGSLENEGFLHFAIRVFFPFIMSKVKNNGRNKGLVCCLECVKHWWVELSAPQFNLSMNWSHTWCFLLCKKMIQWVCHCQSILSPVRKVGGYKSLVSTPAPIRCSFTDDIFTCKITTHNEQMWQFKVDYNKKPITPWPKFLLSCLNGICIVATWEVSLSLTPKHPGDQIWASPCTITCN